MVYRMGVVAALFLSLLAPGAAAQIVIWTTSDPKAGAAVAVGGLMDMVLAEQERLRTTLMTHQKSGLRPNPGEEVLVHPGDIIVARISYAATYCARPRADFVNANGTPLRADSFRVWRMLNNKFCGLSGKKCFDDKNRDGAWDSAGRKGNRWIDVPYEVIEVRREMEGGDRRELVWTESGLEHREWVAGALVSKTACAASMSGLYACGGLAAREIGREGDAVRFAIEKPQ